MNNCKGEYLGGLAYSYVERMAADKAHAHRLAGEHLVLCEGGLFLGRIEPFGVLEGVPESDEIFFICHWNEVSTN